MTLPPDARLAALHDVLLLVQIGIVVGLALVAWDWYHGHSRRRATATAP